MAQQARTRRAAIFCRSEENNNDHAATATMCDLLIEYLSKAKIDGRRYFDTGTGKIELEFFAKMLRQLKEADHLMPLGCDGGGWRCHPTVRGNRVASMDVAREGSGASPHPGMVAFQAL